MDHYAEARKSMRDFVLRGQDYIDPAKLEKSYKLKNAVEVINVLGYALNCPIDKTKITRMISNENLDGKICIFDEKSKQMLERIVKQMPSFEFVLLPLVIKTDNKRALTVLIKCNITIFSAKYVDMVGRIYSTFEDFLENNKLPLSVLYYPAEAKLSLDLAGELKVGFRKVGLKNDILEGADALVATIGVIGTVGAIFATGGMATPLLAASIGSAVYSTGRSVSNLHDAAIHGKSLNPFEDAEARHNWLLVSANLFAFASAGATKLATMKNLSATQAGRICKASRYLRGASASINTIAIIDTVVYSVNHWKELSISEQIGLVCAVCFSCKEIISFANAERIIKTSQIDGLCKFFSECVDTSCKIYSSDFMINARKMFSSNVVIRESALELIKNLLDDKDNVKVNSECTEVSLFGFVYQFASLIRMEKREIKKFIYMLQGIAVCFKEAFTLIRSFCGDTNIFRVVSKQADGLGGGKADYSQAINDLIHLFKMIQQIGNFFSGIADCKIIIARSHKFDLKTALSVFVSIAGLKCAALLNALDKMSPQEAAKMTNLRLYMNKENRELELFKWIVTGSIDSNGMLTKIRFFLAVDEICTEKSLRITDLSSINEVEVESVLKLDNQIFGEVAPAYRPYLVDPKFVRICCKFGSKNHKEYLETLWKNTCKAETRDKGFEKLDKLSAVFERNPSAVENVIAYTKIMNCTNFNQFFCHVEFAMKNYEKLSDASTKSPPGPDNTNLKLKFEELESKVEELSLAGFCNVGYSCSEQLPKQIKDLAKKKELRFGSIENTVINLLEIPSLRLGKREVTKYNQFIQLKKFNEELIQVADNKQMFHLKNEHIEISVAVVNDLGAYIDKITFSNNN